MLLQRLTLSDFRVDMPIFSVGLLFLWAALEFCPEKYMVVIVVAWCAAATQLLQRGVIMHMYLSAQYMDGAHFHRSLYLTGIGISSFGVLALLLPAANFAGLRGMPLVNKLRRVPSLGTCKYCLFVHVLNFTNVTQSPRSLRV